MFPEHLVSMSEDIGKEEHFAASRFMAHTAKKKKFLTQYFNVIKSRYILEKKSSKIK